jgi:alanine racemase
MDKICIDLSGLPPTVGVGDTVTLWGGAGDMYLAADDVATAAGTVAYELFCALAARVPVIEVN